MFKILLVLVAIIAVVSAQSPVLNAIMYSTGRPWHQIMGEVAVFPMAMNEFNNASTICWNFEGLDPSQTFALHVHEYGHVTSLDVEGQSTGGHFNPFEADHGCYPDARHVGDLGNIESEGIGYSFGCFESELIAYSGDASIIGRSFVLHADADTCTGSSGNAGARIAWGVIGVTSEADVYPASWNFDNSSYTATNVNELYVASLIGTQGSYNDTANGVAILYYDADEAVDTFWAIAAIEVTQYYIGAESQIAIHIHQYGDISDASGGANTGGHYNPTNEDHGLVDDADDTSPAHQGDIGNIVVTNGVGMILKTIPLRVTGDGTSPSTFTEAFEALAGRGFVLHADEDDGGQPTGNAGARLAQGVIGVPMDGYFPYYLFPFSSSSSTDPDIFIPGSTGGVNAGNSISPFTFFTFVIASICAYFLSR